MSACSVNTGQRLGAFSLVNTILIVDDDPSTRFLLFGMLAFLGGWLAGLVGIPLTTGTLVPHGIVAALVSALVLILLLRTRSQRRAVHA